MNESARRDFVRSVIGGGVIASAYAAAVMPTGDLLAQIQRTDSEGLSRLGHDPNVRRIPNACLPCHACG